VDGASAWQDLRRASSAAASTAPVVVTVVVMVVVTAGDPHVRCPSSMTHSPELFRGGAEDKG
jgi:hypothetical protein